MAPVPKPHLSNPLPLTPCSLQLFTFLAPNAQPIPPQPSPSTPCPMAAFQLHPSPAHLTPQNLQPYARNFNIYIQLHSPHGQLVKETVKKLNNLKHNTYARRHTHTTMKYTHETLDSWCLSFPSCCCTRCYNLPPSVNSAPSLSTLERDSIPNCFLVVFALTVYMRTHVLFYMPLIYAYFLFKRLCGPPYHACIVLLQLNLAYVTLICSLTN